ncbi:MAG: tyrosine--tRNA ligase [Nitrososphaeria archaeon]
MLNSKVYLAFRNVEEVVTREELENLILSDCGVGYYGTAPTGPFHIGYLVPLGKVADLVKAGVRMKILLADIHAYMDDRKTDWELLKVRTEYYFKCISLLLKESDVEYCVGSSFQFEKEYFEKLYRMSALITVSRAQRAASMVTRMKEPKVSELVYPIMQAIDCDALKVNIALGGIDQRHIYMLTREYFPLLGIKPVTCVFTPLIPSLKGPDVKMSASIPESNIQVYEPEESIRRKVLKAYCPMKEVKGSNQQYINPIVAIASLALLPMLGSLKIERDPSKGGDIVYTDAMVMEKDYVEGKLHPLDLKNSVANVLIDFLKPVRDYFKSRHDLIVEAYPEEVKKGLIPLP